MAATLTNEVSSLSQAYFDEILVLMEYDSNAEVMNEISLFVLILILMEHDSLCVGRFIYHWKNAAAFMS